VNGLRRLMWTLLLPGLLAVAACSGSSNNKGESDGSGAGTKPSHRPSTTHAGRSQTSAPRSTTTAQPAKTEPPPTTPPTTRFTIGFSTPRAAANHLLGAWRAGNRDDASHGTDPAALDAMFAVPVGPVVERGCDTGEFTTSGCQYKAAGGGLQLNMDKGPAGWVVHEALFTPA